MEQLKLIENKTEPVNIVPLSIVKIEEPQARFTQAIKKDLFDENGDMISKYKRVVNKDNFDQVFGIVTEGYKVIQHDDLDNTVNEIVKELELNINKRELQNEEGSRIRIEIRFPDEKLTIGDQKVSLQVVFDNSYNQTTGVRLDVLAYDGRRFYYIGERYSTFYHKHTKGLDIENLKSNLQKGINAFQEKFNEAFQKFLERPLSKQDAINVIDKWIDKKVIAAKYLNMVKELIETGSYEEIVVRDPVSNIWLFYNLISEVLSTKVASQDAQRRYFHIIYRELTNI